MENVTAFQHTAWLELRRKADRAAEVHDLSKSEELLLQSYEQAKALFGPDHAEVGLVLIKLEEVCRLQGKLDLAKGYQAESDKIAELYRIACE